LQPARILAEGARRRATSRLAGGAARLLLIATEMLARERFRSIRAHI